jgi:hypothetical protein
MAHTSKSSYRQIELPALPNRTFGSVATGPPGSRREELLNLIRDGNGLSRGDILERMSLKGDKAGEMSVSNALTALGKSNQVRRESGKYYPGSPEAGEPELPLDATEGDQPPEAAGGTFQG